MSTKTTQRVIFISTEWHDFSVSLPFDITAGTSFESEMHTKKLIPTCKGKFPPARIYVGKRDSDPSLSYAILLDGTTQNTDKMKNNVAPQNIFKCKKVYKLLMYIYIKSWYIFNIILG